MQMEWRKSVWALSAVLGMFLSAGCNSDQAKVNEEIDAGEVALGGSRYDVAVDRADEALHIKPTAQAYYVRARAEEDRPKPDSYIAASDLTAAHADYQAALDMHPPRGLAARCQAGLANVDFAQDDYTDAIAQWSSALNDLEEAPWQAEALYRIGLCQQRLGRYDDADATFKHVQDQYPDQDSALKAQARVGIHNFYVQVADCATQADAQTALETANGAGLPCRQISDHGLFAVRAGPYSTYAQARAAQSLVTQQFPEAIVGP